MSDLISREAVIDVLKQTGIIQDNDRGHLVVDEINRIPTAYDVEKVVEEIEKESVSIWDDDLETNIRVVDKRVAIQAIRKGGAE